MKMDKDALMKHHYWIVAAAAAVLAVGVYMMVTDVDTDIAAKEKEIKETAGKSAGSPPGAGSLEKLDENKKKIEGKKDELWAENANRQKKLLEWPMPAGYEKTFQEYAKLKFGAKELPNFRSDNSIVKAFREQYMTMYDKLGASLEPTILKKVNITESLSVYEIFNERQVTGWDNRPPEAQQVWLALEDFWLAEAMLKPVIDVNDAATRFNYVKTENDSDLSRTFANRNWTVKVSVDTGKRTMEATLSNRLSQMQPLGSKGSLRLKVYLNESGTNPEVVEFQGIQIEGSGSRTFKDIPLVGEASNAKKIVKVEYDEKDARLVPIRQIDKLSFRLIDKQFGTFNKAKLVPPEFWPDEAVVDTSATAGAAGTGATGATGTGGERGGDRTGGAVLSSGGTAAAGTAGAKKIEQAVDAFKSKRYVEVNPQLRRVPVAIKMVVDYRFMQDVLVAYANSPLRMQIVNYNWNRFRGSLYEPPAAGSPAATIASGTPAPAVPAPAPVVNPGVRIERGGGERGGGERGGGERGEGSTIPAFGGLSFNPQGGLTLGTDTGGLATGAITDAQANSSLVELYIFGVVTIYEGAPNTAGAEKAADKATDKAAEKPADKAAEKPADKVIDKAADKAKESPKKD